MREELDKPQELKAEDIISRLLGNQASIEGSANLISVDASLGKIEYEDIELYQASMTSEITTLDMSNEIDKKRFEILQKELKEISIFRDGITTGLKLAVKRIGAK